MRIIRIALTLIMVSALAVSCVKKKEMTMEDFVKIDLQITPTMDDKQIEEVSQGTVSRLSSTGNSPTWSRKTPSFRSSAARSG